MKIINEEIKNLEITDNTVVVPQPTGAAEEESKIFEDRFKKATEVPEDAPLFGAKDQPVPDEVVEPKMVLEESLFDDNSIESLNESADETASIDDVKAFFDGYIDAKGIDMLFSQTESLNEKVSRWQYAQGTVFVDEAGNEYTFLNKQKDMDDETYFGFKPATDEGIEAAKKFSVEYQTNSNAPYAFFDKKNNILWLDYYNPILTEKESE